MKPRLVITDDDLRDPVPPAPQPTTGMTLPPVTTAAPHATVPSAGGALQGTLAVSVLGALVATLLGWVPLEIIVDDNSTASTTGELVASSALQFAAFGGVFGAVYSAWEDVMAGIWSRVGTALGIGLAIGLACGAASGAIAQLLYSELVEDILANIDDFESLENIYNSPSFYFARGFAWAIFGLGVGAAAAAAKRSSRKLVNGLIGGVAGGALGGLFFHWISWQIESGSVGRALGLGVVGLCIGGAIGLVEVARRQAWLRVVAGGMSGKEFILYHQQTNVGSSPKSQITLIKDPAVAAFHARIDDDGRRRTLYAFDGCPLGVNGTPVVRHALRSGDVVQLGGTALQYLERAA